MAGPALLKRRRGAPRTRDRGGRSSFLEAMPDAANDDRNEGGPPEVAHDEIQWPRSGPRHRVRCAVAASDPIEARIVSDLGRQAGWFEVDRGPRDVTFDVPVTCARAVAVEFATLLIDSRLTGLTAARVVDAALVPATPPARQMVKVRWAPPDSWATPLQWGWRAAAGLGAFSAHRHVFIEPDGGRTSMPEARARATRMVRDSPLNGVVPVDGRRTVRYLVGARPRRAPDEPEGRLKHALRSGADLIVMLSAVGVGAFAQVSGPPFPLELWIALAVLALTAVPFGAQWTSSVRLPWIWRLIAGLTLMALLVLQGFIFAEILLKGVSEVGYGPLIVAALVVLPLPGVKFLCYSRWSTGLAKVLAILLSAQVVLVYTADMGWGMFAQSVLGLRPGVLAVGLESRFLMLLTLVLAGSCVLYVALGVLGLLCKYMPLVGHDAMAPMLVVTLSLVFLASLTGIGLTKITAAGAEIHQAARSGKQPDDFLGVSPTLVCVRTGSGVAVKNGPLVTDRPMLTVPTTDGRTWFLDPASQPPSPASVADDQVTTTTWPQAATSCAQVWADYDRRNRGPGGVSTGAAASPQP